MKTDAARGGRWPSSNAQTLKTEKLKADGAEHSGYDGARERGDGITAGNALERSGRGTADGHPSGGSSYNVINIGGGNRPITINAMIELIERELNEQSAVVARSSQLSSFRAVIDRQPANPVDMTDTSADISKARRMLGWSPEVSPEEGFKRTVAWYLENRDWLAAVEVESDRSRKIETAALTPPAHVSRAQA